MIYEKFFPLAILIPLDFIYLIPIYILSLIINLIITLVWYFPSIYQLYSFIFTEKEYDLRIRIYLFLLSPIIIILYIPFSIICSIGYCIFISLVNPLIIIIQRSEYPLYSLSLTAAIIRLIYKYTSDYSNEDNLTDSLVLERIREIMLFIKNYWYFNSVKISKRIKLHDSYICKFMIIKSIWILDLITIISIIILILPYIILLIITYSLMFRIKLYNFINGLLSSLLHKFTRRKLYYFMLLFLFILAILAYIFLCLFSISLVLLIITSILYSIITKSIELYIRNGFYDVIALIWVIVIEPFLEIEDIIYICCGVEIKYREDMLDIL